MSSTSRTLNPLLAKVSTVLSTSYADGEFRSALSLVDDRGIGTKVGTRRRLRLGLQKEVIETNRLVIDEFGRVAEQLLRIGATLERINSGHVRARCQVSSAHKVTSVVLEDASAVLSRKRIAEAKERLLQTFRYQCILSQDEAAILGLAADLVDDNFFAVLSKAKRIVRDCELLLGFESQTLGLEIMEYTSKNINLAFQKLSRWLQREFKGLNLENPHIGSSIRRALRTLAERPSLFQNCLDTFAEAREQVLSDAYYTALTGSSAMSTPDRSRKPIELVAHDSLRYAGDMLAWIHSATVSEREALEVLFVSGDGSEIIRGLQASRENEVWRLLADDIDGSPTFDAVKALNDLVDRDMSGAIRILRQRVEQVIQTNEDTTLAYKLANLLNFYRITFAKLLSTSSLLVQSLGSLEADALRQFRALMKDHIATLQGDFQHPPSDLSPPGFLQDAMEKLKAILKSYETSLTPSSNREIDFQPILSDALDPFLLGCENMSRGISPPARHIFLINCLRAAQTAMESFDFTYNRREQLQIQIELELQKIRESQYRFLRTESGLDLMFSALGPLTEGRDSAIELRSLEVLQPTALVQARHTLDDFLPSALMDAMENVKRLQDASLARRVTEEAAERFCIDFEHIENMLVYADEVAEHENVDQNGKGSPTEEGFRAMFPRTAGEIRVLLS
ncbi:Oligomeric Golgi complex subunit 6 [Pleurostoma richardsiae]|uniref:Conserved oligomeric Golgi complex subunit 6 n=1 Tax=Pleurostoma richardsiae TaxID=41990 RepID=A0AA38VIZ7_9PEZI|nr:Oligomeric Golgi complex subunit 6 [Pleurostoma richardsiae]